MEVLRKHGARLTALNDSVDTLKGDDDFTPFRNIMNEWYARDTSKKIKSTFKAKGKSGKHVTSTTPYGYLKDKDDPNVYADGRCCNFANSRKDLLDWLKALKDEKVVDIRKVYKNGVTDSVIDNYRRYLEK